MRTRFEDAVDKFFAERPCDNANAARVALLALYDFLVQKVKEGEDARQAIAEAEPEKPESVYWMLCWYVIQQTMTWSPLRLFWRVLAEDDLEAIRAAAKGNICDATAMAEFGGDPEVGKMAQANLAIMFSGLNSQLQEQMQSEERLQYAYEMWMSGGHGMPFTPEIRVMTL